MKYIILISIFGAMLMQACAQNTDLSGKTNIPSTRLYLDVPEGFHVSQDIIGLEKNDYVVITVLDLVGGNYYSNAATFNRKGFEEQGVSIISYKEKLVDEFPAKMVHYKSAIAEGYVIVFGDSTFSTMITGMVTKEDEKSLLQIEKCLNNITYDKSLKVDLLEFAKFELNTENSIYKFLKASSSMYTFTIGGKEIESIKEESTFTVAQIPYDENQLTLESVSQEIISTQLNNGFQYNKIISERTFEHNGNEAYELLAEGVYENQEIQSYLLVVVKGNTTLYCSGLAKDDYERNLEEYKKLGRSIRFKQ